MRFLEVLTPEVAVADLTAFGEGAVVVFEAIGGAVVGYADEEGSSVSGVGEAGDGFDGGVLDDFGLLLLFDVPAEGGFVFEVERFRGRRRAGHRMGPGLLVSDDGLFLYLGCVDGCYRGPAFPCCRGKRTRLCRCGQGGTSALFGTGRQRRDRGRWVRRC